MGELEYVPRKFIALEGGPDSERAVHIAFQKHSKQDPVHIIHYNEDETVDEKGEPLDE